MHDQVSRPTGFLPAGIVSIGPSGWLFDGSGRANSMLSPPSVLTASPAPGGKLPKSTPFDSNRHIVAGKIIACHSDMI